MSTYSFYLRSFMGQTSSYRSWSRVQWLQRWRTVQALYDQLPRPGLYPDADKAHARMQLMQQHVSQLALPFTITCKEPTRAQS